MTINSITMEGGPDDLHRLNPDAPEPLRPITAGDEPGLGLQSLDWAALADEPVPLRKWIVPDWILPRAVTLVAGAGGTGKSLLVQQWLTAIGTGAEFMGLRPSAAMPTLYVNCEDDSDELHRRQFDICNAFARSISGIAGHVFTVARVGEASNALGRFDEQGRFLQGALLDDIRAFALANRCRVVALDNLAHLFPGNENDRVLVTAFLNALSRLALDIDGAVILIGHPAKVAGSEFSGSTAWEAGVRTRLYLKRKCDGDGEEIEGSDRRILSRNKANYTGQGDCLTMEWRGGAFWPEDGPGETEEAHEQAFLACLDEATAVRRNVSDKPSAAYAPKIFAGMKPARGASKVSLERAMQRLFDRGEIVANSPLWRDEKNRRDVTGIVRANPPESAQTPRADAAQTGCADPRRPLCANPRTDTPYTTYRRAGPDGPPPLSDDELADWQEMDAAVAAKLWGPGHD